MTLYLNNDGSRWVEVNAQYKRDMPFILVRLVDGQIVRERRQADYYFAFGNFGGLSYRVKGKRFQALPCGADGYDTRDESWTGEQALQHVFHEMDHETRYRIGQTLYK